MAALIASVVFLYLLVCLLAILVIVLYRQFGLVYVGARRGHELTGRAVGAPAPEGLRVVSPFDGAAELALDWSAVPADSATFLLLGGEACPVCEQVLGHLDEGMPPDLKDIRVLFVDRDPGAWQSTVPAPANGCWQHWRSIDGSVHDAFDVEVSPVAFVIDHEGVIRGKGITSSPQAVSHLLHESGFPRATAAQGTAAHAG
jgi:hypothetical protein